MGWFMNGKALLKRMIWGYHHLRKHPYRETEMHSIYMDITPLTQDPLVVNEGFYFNVEILEP